VVAPGPTIEKQHLPLHTLSSQREGGKRLSDVEHYHIEEILKETAWNISRSAAILDIDRVTLYHKIEKYGLKREQ
ncbi:MAG: helix-turn-helix domain-containing protein, partial [Bacteroidota bacterium]